MRILDKIMTRKNVSPLIYWATRQCFLMIIAASTLVACSSPTDPWPDSRWTSYEPEYGMTVKRSVPIVMDDGATLYVDIGYPTDPATGKKAIGTFPVLLSQNQYMVPGSNRSVFSPIKYFVSRGYIYVVAQVRGAGKTEGPGGEKVALDMFSHRMALDGAQLVNWAASELQESNGTIGLDGCSFLGITQLFTAAELGPDSPVKAIAPACAGNSYELYFPGGMMAGTTILGSFAPGLVIAGSKNLSVNMALQSSLSKREQQGEDEAYNREYWQGRDTINTAEKIVANGIPALLWTGWHAAESKDALKLYVAFQNAAVGRPILAPMTAEQSLTGRYQIIVGPQGHGDGIQSNDIKLQWFDHWLKGQDTGIDKTPTPMHMIELHSNRWLNLAHLPVTDTYTSLYASKSGKLNLSQPDADYDSIRWTRPRNKNGKLTYTSAPFDKPMTIAGAPSASLWASSTNTNLELIATLYDVDPQGQASEITHGALLGSMRALDEQTSWVDTLGNIIFPHYLFQTDNYLVPGIPYRLDIGLYPTLWALDAGHALRMEITTRTDSNDCAPTGLLNTPSPCGLTKPQQDTLPGGVYRLLLGGDSASRIHVPLVERP